MAENREQPFTSNAFRLSTAQWLVVGMLLVGIGWALPNLWPSVERFDIDLRGRMPYQLSNDYWLWSCASEQAVDEGKTLVLGDSVVWGQYVAPDGTLSHYLNELAERAGRDEQYANLGLDGAHPAALAGLIEHYGSAIKDRSVILQCNLLWLTSPKHDLRTEKEFRFNHPRLVPQFRPEIPCYVAGRNERLGIVLERHVGLFSWANHLRMTYFDSKAIASWTLANPYRIPLAAMALRVPASSKKIEADPQPWTQRGMDQADFPWVPLEESFQWRRFRHAVDVLLARGNRVLVVVGPFNEHMLLGDSAGRYAKLRAGMAEWLASRDVPHVVPPVLPSGTYADASHPIASGYKQLAEWVVAQEAFATFVE